MADKTIIKIELLVAGNPPQYANPGSRLAAPTQTWKGWASSVLHAPGLIIESIEERPATQ